MHDALERAVRSAGGLLVPYNSAEVLIWDDPRAADAFPEVIAQCPNVKWIQLPWAGIEPFLPHLDHNHTWTSGKDVYSRPVAEWVVAAMLTAFRDFHRFVGAHTWPHQSGRNVLGSSLTILGGGGIAAAIIDLLEPWDVEISVVRRTDSPMSGAAHTFTTDHLIESVADADAVVVAAALTDSTQGLIDNAVFDGMRPDAWLINVARGPLVVTADLIAALRSGAIAGAVLDVTDPEPLPDHHPLWDLPNCIITPHVGNTPEMGLPLLAARVAANTQRWIDNRPLVGVVDVDAGY